MVNNANDNPVSTNIRIRVETKKKLEAEALVFGETHNDIIERLLKKEHISKGTKAKYEDKV